MRLVGSVVHLNDKRVFKIVIVKHNSVKHILSKKLRAKISFLRQLHILLTPLHYVQKQ